jgi:hypothetical protein
MFDELFKTDDEKDESKDAKSEVTGGEAQAFEEGRTNDSPNFFHTDSPSEAEARERGEEARIDAETTREEDKEAKEKEDD